ncbi:EB module domain-containing protein [Ditylenchus destructor]|nr:EB module domain-containing protein [Ditylenchus destructor]
MQDDANEDKEGYCSPVEVKKDGMCYLRKRPGELCHFSEQCIDAGSAQYYCIASLCQIPPECQPGHTAVGAECFPFSVTVTPVQCPHPNSVPQMNSLSGEVATCMHDSCSPGYSCQFSTYGRGSYVCCSNIPIVPNSTANRRRFGLKRRGKQKQVTEKQPTKYKSAYVFLYHCCRDRECRMRRKQIMLICGRLFTSNNAEII